MEGRILIVVARFYEDLADMLVEGAVAALTEADYTYERVNVSGVLEIPTAIYYALQSKRYVGFVALGVVIRGETSHYEIVGAESARGLMELGVRRGAIIGNGIQTVENKAQALERCDKTKKDKGGHAARACLSLLTVQAQIIERLTDRE